MSKHLTEAGQIGFLLVRLFPLYCLVLAIETLRLANRYGADPPLDWLLLSTDGHPVEASNAMRMEVDGAIATSPSLSHLFILAGDAPTSVLAPPVASWLNRLDRSGTVLGAADSGAFVLAEAGLLTGHETALHPTALSPFRERFPNLGTSIRPLSLSPRRMTCGGGVAIAQLMREVIAESGGPALARTVMDDMLIDTPIPAGPPPKAKVVAKALRLMSEAIEEPFGLTELAAATGVSERTLSRLFRRDLGVPPMRHYLRIRLRQAQQLLYQTELSLTEIALATGFQSLSAFSRAFRAEFGRPARWMLRDLRLKGHALRVPPAFRGKLLRQ